MKGYQMKKDVTINIRSIFNYEHTEPDVIEMFTTGEFYRKGSKYYISYLESEATGFEGARTTLMVGEDQSSVTLSRSGREKAQLIVQNGVRHQCHYDMGFGDMMIGISGSSIHSSLSDSGGRLEFKYSLDVNSLLASENELLIIVNEQ
jgi:uncharacterized beta-barrel protein YwiB (DUF1934 family)